MTEAGIQVADTLRATMVSRAAQGYFDAGEFEKCSDSWQFVARDQSDEDYFNLHWATKGDRAQLID